MCLDLDRKQPENFFLDNPGFHPDEHLAVQIVDVVEDHNQSFTVVSYLGHAHHSFISEDIVSGNVTIITNPHEKDCLLLNDGDDADDAIILAGEKLIALLSRITGLDIAQFAHQAKAPSAEAV